MAEDIKEKIKRDTDYALKKGEQVKRLVLNLLLTAIKNKEIEKRTKLAKEGEQDLDEKSKLTDEEIISVISTEAKKRKEAIEAYGKADREELAAKERDELTILEFYLPEQMSEEEIRDIVKQIIDEAGAKDLKDMGKVMNAVMVKVKGQASGQIVSNVVKELLS